MHPRAFALVLGISLACAPATGRANGRFPQSNALVFAPADRNLVALRTTFGLLVSRDRGQAWDWVCEQAFGVAGAEDPAFAFTPGGALFAATYQGLFVSRDGACSFSNAEASVGRTLFVDLTSRKAAPETIVALASAFESNDDAGAARYATTLFSTSDDGRSYQTIAASIAPSLVVETVDVAPTDASRIYVSGWRVTNNNGNDSAEARLLASYDRGVSWQTHPIALEGSERGVYIAAISPTNADNVYVRTDGGMNMPSRLLFSRDAGRSFETVLRAAGPLSGFALSDSGDRVWVGGPRDALQTARTTDHVFSAISSVEVSCLAFADDGLWACSSERHGFVVGRSRDEGKTFEPLLRFCDIRGPLACAPGTTTFDQCVSKSASGASGRSWSLQRAELGCTAQLPRGDSGLSSRADAGATSDSMQSPSNSPNASNDEGCTTQPSHLASSVRLRWFSRSAAGFGAAIGVALVALRSRRRRRVR